MPRNFEYMKDVTLKVGGQGLASEMTHLRLNQPPVIWCTLRCELQVRYTQLINHRLDTVYKLLSVIGSLVIYTICSIDEHRLQFINSSACKMIIIKIVSRQTASDQSAYYYKN